jgi:hypothetical protein
MMTSTFEVSVDGSKIFTWEGDREVVENVREAVPRGAKDAGVTEDQLADMSIHLLIKEGHLISTDPVGQEMQMMAIVWRILETETGNPNHPGKIASYVGGADFSVDIHSTETEGNRQKVTCEIVVSPHVVAGTA